MTSWKTSTLGAECSIAIGGTPARNRREFWDENHIANNLWASIADLRAKVLTSTDERLTNLGVAHSNAKLVMAGSVLLSFKLTLGRVAIAGTNLYTNEAIAALTSETLDHEFLYYGLQSWDLLADVDQAIKGATLNKAKLRRIPIRFPEEGKIQRTLASTLAQVDQAIEQTEALLEKRQRIKTGLTRDLLTRGLDAQGRLRDPTTHCFKPSPLGSIPQEWVIGSLLDATDPTRQPILTGPFGADLGIDDFVEQGVPVLRIGNVQQGRLDFSDLLFVSAGKAEQLKKYTVRSGDLLFARQGATTGRNALANDRAAGCLINYHIIRVALDHSRCAPVFIEAAFNSDSVQRQVDREKGRGTREGINTAQLKAIQLKLAPVSEQRAIESVISVLSNQVNRTELSLAKLRRLRTGLMQDLLTGRVSVTPLLASSPPLVLANG